MSPPKYDGIFVPNYVTGATTYKCPSGYDCLINDLYPRVMTLANHSDTHSNNNNNNATLSYSIACDDDQFAGYYCNGDDVLLCPAGQYCPSSSQQLICPTGKWCPAGATDPFTCPPLALCGAEGTKKSRWFLIMILVTIVFVTVWMTYYYFVVKPRRRKAQAIYKQQAARNKQFNDTATATAAAAAAGHSNNALAIVTPQRQISESVELSTVSHAMPRELAVAVNEPATTTVIDQLHSAKKLSLELTCHNINVTINVTEKQQASASSSLSSSAAGKDPTTDKPSSSSHRKTILHDFTSTFRSGQLSAIMGPSGSGKTTCITALLNMIPISNGHVTINSHRIEISQLGPLVGYVPQSDIMYTQCTVRDVLLHSARTRLSKHVSDADKIAKVNETMELLRLTHCADTIIGDERVRGISGGEKKRVSIGMELVADPLFLFLDEPTTGLDSNTSIELVDMLRNIAHTTGCVVICVIHQPRYEIFQLFHQVILLATGGYQIYTGHTDAAVPFFVDMGYGLPPFVNPADWMMDILSLTHFLTTFHSYKQRPQQQQQQPNAPLLPQSSAAASSSATAKNVIHDNNNSVIFVESKQPETNNDTTVAAAATTEPTAAAAAAITSDEPESDCVVFHVAPTSHAATATTTTTTSLVTVVAPPLVRPMTPTSKIAPSPSSIDLTATNTSSSSAASSMSSSYLTDLIVARSASRIPFSAETYYYFYRACLSDIRDMTWILLDSLLEILPGAALGINGFGDDPYLPPLPVTVANLCPAFIRDRCLHEAIFDTPIVYGTFFVTMIIGAVSSIFAVSTFGRVQLQWRREALTGGSVYAYFVSKNVYDVLHILRQTFIFLGPYMIMGAPRGSFGQWFFIVFSLMWASFGMGYFISMILPPSKATTVSVIAGIALSVTSGLTPNFHTVSKWSILQVFWYLSYNYWGAQAMLTANTSGQPIRDRIVDTMDHKNAYDISQFDINIGMILVIGCIWRIAALAALRFYKTKH